MRAVKVIIGIIIVLNLLPLAGILYTTTFTHSGALEGYILGWCINILAVLFCLLKELIEWLLDGI